MTTLFERVGGEPALDAAVAQFYKIVLADERIARFFAGTDMARLAMHQRLFLKYAFGGMPNYPGQAMRKAHHRLVHEMGLNESHFEAVLEDLGQSLRDLGATEDIIAEVVAVAETTRDDVLDRPA